MQRGGAPRRSRPNVLACAPPLHVDLDRHFAAACFFPSGRCLPSRLSAAAVSAGSSQVPHGCKGGRAPVGAQPAERCSVRQGRFRVAPSHCCTVAPLNQGECAHISLPLNLPSLDLCAHFAGCCKSPRTHPKNVRTFRTRPKVRTNGPALARWRGKKCAHISRERAEREGNVRTFAGSAVQAVRQCNSATVRPAHTRRPA